jgi:hypothetical protein
MSAELPVGLTDPIPVEYLADPEATLSRYVDSPAFDMMAELHGVELPNTEDRDGRLAAIADMSDRFWDLRGMQGGVERQNVKLDKIGWADMPGLHDVMTPGSPSWNTVFAVAELFGMVKDNVLPDDLYFSGARYALGAAASSMLPRVQLLLGHKITTPKPGVELPGPLQIDSHRALQDHSGVIIGLGTHRPLNKDAGEDAIAASYAPYATQESDLVLAAFERELAGRYTKTTYPIRDVGYEYLPGSEPTLTELSVDKGSLVVLSLHAPQPAVTEKGRAQTPHTYAMTRTVLRDIVQLDPGATVVGGSNSIYQFQNAAAANAFSRLGLHNLFTSFGHETAGTGRQAAQFLPEFRSLEIQLRYLAQAVAASR